MGLPSPTEPQTEESPESRNRVEVRVAEGGFRQTGIPNETRLIRSGCGAADVSSMSETLPKLSQGLTVDAAIILGLGKALRHLQALHPEVGGTHSAALFTATGEAVTQAEDIGRHNAVDKVAGYCLLRRIPLEDKILVTSGRASYEMATKAVRLGISVAATISAPTLLAVQIAEEHGLTMIGYLRGERMNVYTHSERLQKISA
jgi:FdhD protein